MSQLPAIPEDVDAVVRHALSEDLGERGDLTAQLIPADTAGRATVICREAGVVCGRPWFEAAFRQIDPTVRIDWSVQDGDAVAPDTVLCRIEGPARALLSAERTALNFFQTLSGTATTTRRYVDAVAGTDCRILDTRKTLPGLRRAQKYAVTCGGGHNHRMGLFDAILIKENHLLAHGSLAAAVRAARAVADAQSGPVTVQVEVESLAELEAALAAGADLILLDNFDLAGLREAVRINVGRSQLEASGGLTLDQVTAVAQTGVDRISVGALTKDVRALDLSMRFTTES